MSNDNSSETHGADDGWPRSPLVVGALALVLFGATAAPGVLWGDSAKLTLMALDVELLPQPGGHPTYVLLAALWVRLWPSDPAYALNMFSVISAAIAVALLYRSLRFSIGTAGAAFAAVTLACSHLFWNSATLAESYAPAAAILAGLLALSVGYFDDPRPWRLWLAALLLGLGAGINSIVIIALPALAIPLIHRWRQTGLRHVLPAVLFMGLGLVPFMVAGVVMGSGVWSFMAGAGGEFTAYAQPPAEVLRELFRYPLYLAYQVPGPQGLVLIPGLVWLWRHRRPELQVYLGVWLLVVAFGALWLRQRQFMILSVGAIPMAAVAGGGFRWLIDLAAARSRRSLARLLIGVAVAAPILLYALVPGLSARLGVDLTGGARTVPYREMSYFLQPWKAGVTGPMRYADEALAVLGPGDHILADFTLARVLWYGQRVRDASREPIIEIDSYIGSGDSDGFMATLEAALEEGRVFLADDESDYYFLVALGERFELTPVGPLFEVLPGG